MEQLHGCLVVDKPRGMTSHDVVNRLRKLLKTKKIGHTGTLDPETTGVLVLCVGEATKLIQFLPEKTKEYSAEITLGIATTTEDFTGDITSKKEVTSLTEVEVDTVLKDMLSITEQIPPMYSAIKMNGKKLYELARKNEVVERKPRPVEVYSCKRTSDITVQDEKATFHFDVMSSKGFYVRSFCVEIGERLHYPAHMSQLRRTASGDFTIDQAISLENLEAGQIHLISMADMLSFERYSIPEEQFKAVRNGMTIENPGYTDKVFMMQENKVIALYQAQDKYLKPVKVFYYGNN